MVVKELQSKMNGIRQMYLNCCKSILKNLESKENELQKSNVPFQPSISLNLRNIITTKIENIRELAVNNIAQELSTFLSQRGGGFQHPLNHKKAKRFSKKIIEILESSFRKDKYPTDTEKLRLANLCMISTKQVNNWFTNKRNRSKSYKNGFITYDK
ncbi:uncharacterized protein VICG_01568 [Vittaforma corneae ATCC 50505]|uniref:Homeobox domain-containing protein n=1 Tax=Vittaforma corneae (strain ATCC 50505) TaxID=993615 RepID=L2GKC0_VITCO|nr:uncharacterized protein VICG_01568 [Vittaforma corneae ATCC 50505]ELA41328.1 hypothetical protein VICG_01568 [Vittaforma corneae ATCC 50505]